MLNPVLLSTFGKNMLVCLSLLGKTHQDLAEGTNISTKKIKNLHTGTVTLTSTELQRIADELNIPVPHLTRGYPSRSREDRLRIILEDLGLIASDTVHTEPFHEEFRLPPTIRRTPQPAVLIVGGENARAVNIPKGPSVLVFPPPPTGKNTLVSSPKVPGMLSAHSEGKAPIIKPPKAKKPSPLRKLPVTNTINPAFVMSFEGIDYNLQDKALLKEIVDRIRYVKGGLTYNELALRLAKKRSYAWLIKLGGITPAEVVDIANICGVTVKALITGEGIVSLPANEKASTWLERYSETTHNKDNLKEVAHEIMRGLEVWPAPLRHMLIKYIAENM